MFEKLKREIRSNSVYVLFSDANAALVEIEKTSAKLLGMEGFYIDESGIYPQDISVSFDGFSGDRFDSARRILDTVAKEPFDFRKLYVHFTYGGSDDRSQS